MKKRIKNLTLILLSLSFCTCATKTIEDEVDILIIGGGASGIAAGIQAARMNKNTLIIENTPWLGGMLTAAGVSAIDGNHNLPSGFWGEFRDSLSSHYGSLESLETGWVSKVQFEPSVGNSIFQNMAAKENNLNILYNSSLVTIEKKKDLWYATINSGGNTKVITAKLVIDASELGDVAEMCGVSYKIGMDSRIDTKEKIAPEKANNIVQDLTYVTILKDYGKDVTIPRPANYDSTYFVCAAMNPLCINPKEPDRVWSPEEMITYGKLPNNKYMINWPIEGNDYYLNLIEQTEEERTEALKEAKSFSLCFLYFIQKELGFNTLGLADDEFLTDDLLPFIPYHRESRRIDGVVEFTLNHISEPFAQPEKLYRTAIAVGDYPVDHHHARYDGYDELPNLYFYPVPSYGLPLGTLIPKDVDGLLVAEKSISVTNLVNGTTRLQPVVLQIGQAAGILAALSVEQNKRPRDVSVRDVQNVLLESGGYLLPYLDVDKKNDNFKTYQRIGATGILQSEGRNVGWTNETWLRVTDPLLTSELQYLSDLYPSIEKTNNKKPVTYGQVIEIINSIKEKENITLLLDVEDLVKDKQMSSIISRGDFAILLDKTLDPFNTKHIDLYGNIK